MSDAAELMSLFLGQFDSALVCRMWSRSPLFTEYMGLPGSTNDAFGKIFLKWLHCYQIIYLLIGVGDLRGVSLPHIHTRTASCICSLNGLPFDPTYLNIICPVHELVPRVEEKWCLPCKKTCTETER